MSSLNARAQASITAPLPSPLPQYSEFAAPSPARRQAPPPPPLRRAAPAPAPAASPESAAPRARQGFLRDHTILAPLLTPRVSAASVATAAPGPRITGAEAKAIKFFDKWTSKVGLAKAGALVGLTGLAGVGGYFGVHAIMAAVAAGFGAKLGAILIPVGIGIAAALVAVVVGRILYKGWKQMRNELVAKRAQCA